ncbi:MAG: hypothetical protein M1826_005790 [Phylliscum demangeonii]|nr:MAG: hypothetical protein M1826_005790 [Phylliscum demangeonii]
MMRSLLWDVTLASLWLWTAGAVPGDDSIRRQRHQHPHGGGGRVHAKRSASASASDAVLTPQRPDQGRSNECGRVCCSMFFARHDTYWTIPVADFALLFQCFRHCEDNFHYPPVVDINYVDEVQFGIDTSVRACNKEGTLSSEECRKKYSKGGLMPNPRSWYFDLSPVLDARQRLATVATEAGADLARLAHSVHHAVPLGVRTMMMRAGHRLQRQPHRPPLVRPHSSTAAPAVVEGAEGAERAVLLHGAL